MQTKKILTLTIFLIIFLTISLFGCVPKSSELEKTVMQLQDEIAKKEQAIKDLQEKNAETNAKVTEEETTTITKEEEKASLTEDAKALLVIDSYINAIESKDFTEQKKYVAKYALDLVNFKEYESKGLSAEIREVERKPSKIDKIAGNKAEGFMSFTEHAESLITKDKYDL